MRITGSRLALYDFCPAAAALPHLSSTSGPAERGTAVHAYLEHAPQFGRQRALQLVPDEWRPLAEMIDMDELQPYGLAYEVSFALEPSSGRALELGRGIGRDAAYRRAPPGWLCMTLDVVGISADAVRYDDYKITPWRKTRARDDLQILAGCLAAARAYGRFLAVGTIVRIDPETGHPRRDCVELDGFALDEIEQRLWALALRCEEQQHRLTRSEQLDYHEGPHCQWCPARESCGAKLRLLRAVHHGVELETVAAQAEALPTLTIEQVGALWTRSQRMRRALDVLDARIVEVARTVQPIPLGENRYLGPQVVLGNERLAPDDVAEAIRAECPEHADVIEAQALPRTVNKKAMEAALRRQYGRAGAKRNKTILARCRPDGKPNRPETIEVREYEVKDVEKNEA